MLNESSEKCKYDLSFYKDKLKESIAQKKSKVDGY